MSEPIRLRPFRRHLERERHLPMLEVSGRIEDKRFIVSAIGCEVQFDTVEVGEDERGPYAVVNESEQALPNGFKVRVELEPDQYLPHGGAIDIFLEGRIREDAREQLRREGIDPDTVMLLVPYERFFSVSFDSLGLVNGGSSSYIDDGTEPQIN